MHVGTMKPLLLPTPQRMVLTGALVDAGRIVGRFGEIEAASAIGPVEHSSNPEAYAIQIGQEPGDVRIFASSAAGERYAKATLHQLLKQYGGRLPVGRIEDWPDFAVRGVMLDISRNKVPTMAHFAEMIELLAALKFNHLQLYTEHTFAYAGHEEAWKDASPITPDEAMELTRLCAMHGIELCPNQNCFGHLASWLKLPGYQHLAEVEGDGVWKFMHWERRGAFSLCPIEPKAAAFVDDLLTQMCAAFDGSERVNIGCDETFDVGWGRSKAEAERRAARRIAAGENPEHAHSAARAELYFEFVRRIAGSCARLGKRPMMWADIALTHPEMLHLLPADMLGLAWWYEPTEKFENWVKEIRRNGMEAWVCPGTSSWRSITGRTKERRGNICDAAEQGLRAGATGFLVCDWGDVGHRQQWPISLIGMAHAAEAAWNVGKARVWDARAASLHVFDDATLTIGPWLEELGDSDVTIREHVKLTNATALFNDLHPPVPGMLKAGERQIKAEIGYWKDARGKLEAIRSRVPLAADERVREELVHSVTEAIFAADHAITMRDGSDARERTGLAERCRQIRSDHERLWLRRNRAGGLPLATAHYDAVIAALDAKA